jgi:hypothetical protein
VPYGLNDNGRIPNAVQEAQPWRIHAIVPDFVLEDVWALPAVGSADEFPELLAMVTAMDPAHAESLPTRALWQLRDRLGEWFDLGRISESVDQDSAARNAGAEGDLPIPGSAESSLRERLPDDLRDTTAGLDFGSLPFVPLYVTENEAAAEISNRTVHGVAHFAWVDRGDGTFQGQMAVYVKPRGRLGEGYMAVIKPFRYWIVYPALMKQFARSWERRASGRRRGTVRT